jgi:hypothetical protein
MFALAFDPVALGEDLFSEALRQVTLNFLDLFFEGLGRGRWIAGCQKGAALVAVLGIFWIVATAFRALHSSIPRKDQAG